MYHSSQEEFYQAMHAKWVSWEIVRVKEEKTGSLDKGGKHKKIDRASACQEIAQEVDKLKSI